MILGLTHFQTKPFCYQTLGNYLLHVGIALSKIEIENHKKMNLWAIDKTNMLLLRNDWIWGSCGGSMWVGGN
jgi:hypothetical protein